MSAPGTKTSAAGWRASTRSGTLTWSDDDAPDVIDAVKAAQRELKSAVEILRELDAPGADVDRVLQRSADLRAGTLTHHRQAIEPGPAARVETAPAPREPPAPKVLISYSHRDGEFAAALADRMDRELPGVWIDRWSRCAMRASL